MVAPTRDRLASRDHAQTPGVTAQVTLTNTHQPARASPRLLQAFGYASIESLIGHQRETHHAQRAQHVSNGTRCRDDPQTADEARRPKVNNRR